MDDAFDGLSNQKKVVNDILAYGKDVKEHVNQIRTLLQRCQKKGISTSKKKFKFAQAEYKYS